LKILIYFLFFKMYFEHIYIKIIIIIII